MAARRPRRRGKAGSPDPVDLTPKLFFEGVKEDVKHALKRRKPLLHSQANGLLTMANATYGTAAIMSLRDLQEHDQSSEHWVTQMLALGIGQAVRVFGWGVERIAGYGSTPVKPTKTPIFDLDQASQATDPIPLEVSQEIHDAVRDGRINVKQGLGPAGEIPVDNIRLSVKDGVTYISLVELGKLGLDAGDYKGPIKVGITPHTAQNPVSKPIEKVRTIAAAHARVAEHPSPEE